MFHPRRVIAVLLMAGLFGCGNDSSAPVQQPFEGTYQLVRMNGAVLPYTSSMQGISVTVTSGTLELEADSTYIMSAVAVASFLGQSSPVPVYSEGTYVRSGNDISFPFSLESTQYNVSGTVRGGVIKLTTAEPMSPIRSMELRRRSN